MRRYMETGGRVHDARVMKWLAFASLLLVGASLALVHSGFYEPGVSYVLLYMVVAVVVTGSVSVLLLPAEQFRASFNGGVYVFYAALFALMTFFTGASSSSLYLLFVPLLVAPALQGSAVLGGVSLGAVAITYTLAMLPGLLEGGNGDPATVLFRLGALVVVGVFAVVAGRGRERESAGYSTDEDGSVLMELVSAELGARKGVKVGVLLVDPGSEVEDYGLLMERVGERIGEPVVLKRGPVFGVVLTAIEERSLESAARRALSAAGSLGASQSRAGAAIYPKDGRNAGELLASAGEALEESYSIDSPTAIVLAGRRSRGDYRAAR